MKIVTDFFSTLIRWTLAQDFEVWAIMNEINLSSLAAIWGVLLLSAALKAGLRQQPKSTNSPKSDLRELRESLFYLPTEDLQRVD